MPEFPGLIGSFHQQYSSDAFRKDPGVAENLIQTTTAGLDAELTQSSDETWTIVLTDDQGTEVYRRDGYANNRSAKSGAYQWVRRHYQVEAEEAVEVPEEPVIPEPAPKKRAAPHTKKAPSSAHLSKLLNLRADRNEEKAIALRTQADQLETEAKRLREAADTLGLADGSA